MRCRHCPLREDTEQKDCPILDENSELRYEDNHGNKAGCYVQKWFIVHKARQLKEQTTPLPLELSRKI